MTNRIDRRDVRARDTRAICVGLSLVACIATPGALWAQSDQPDAGTSFEKGFRLSTGISYGYPWLDSRVAALWERAGKFGGGGGVDIGLGYDWSRFGLSLELSPANASLNVRHAVVLSLSAVAHWIPPVSFNSAIGSLHPIVTGGYVREALAGVKLINAELPPEIATQDLSTVPSSMTMYGNSARLGVAVETTIAPSIGGRFWRMRKTASAFSVKAVENGPRPLVAGRAGTLVVSASDVPDVLKWNGVGCDTISLRGLDSVT